MLVIVVVVALTGFATNRVLKPFGVADIYYAHVLYIKYLWHLSLPVGKVKWAHAVVTTEDIAICSTRS